MGRLGVTVHTVSLTESKAALKNEARRYPSGTEVAIGPGQAMDEAKQKEEAKYNRVTNIVCYLILAGIVGVPFFSLLNQENKQADKVVATVGDAEARFYRDLSRNLVSRLAIKSDPGKTVWLLGLSKSGALEQLSRSGLDNAVAVRQSAWGGSPERWDVLQCYSRLPKRDGLVVQAQRSRIVWFEVGKDRIGFIVSDPALPKVSSPAKIDQWKVVEGVYEGKDPDGLVGIFDVDGKKGLLIDPELSAR